MTSETQTKANNLQVGAGTLLIQDNEVLLVQLNYGKVKGSWILPGGWVEDGESLEAAALRELQEETNQSAEILGPLCVRYRKNPINTYWVFLAKASKRNDIKFNPSEIMAVKYWPIKEALESTEIRPMTKYFVQSFIEKDFSGKNLPEKHKDIDHVYFFGGDYE